MEKWPHLQDILGTESWTLKDRLIAIGVSASVACLESHRLARQLMRHGAQVQFFLTPSACRLVSPTALGWCTGRPPIVELTARCEHLEYFGVHGRADLLLLAPCTANTLAKIAVGIDDNAVTTCVTTALGMEIPVLCAPGMHEPMMKNPAVTANLARVKDYGVEVLTPVLAEGKQKMMAVPEIVARVRRRLGPGDLADRRVLITGGPTREFIDPARCLTNPSSGLTACLLAEEAYRRGAEVTLVYGPGKTEPADWISTVRVDSATQMQKACLELVENQHFDIFVACAAVSDFRPTHYQARKLPTSLGAFELSLEVTPKILDSLRRASPRTMVAAFKAASSSNDKELREASLPYLELGRADIVIGNSISTPGLGFDSDHNRFLVTDSQGSEVIGPGLKRDIVSDLWSRLSGRIST